MRVTRVIAVGVIVSSLGVAASVHAQTLKNASDPAETPPSSFTSNQYVDSRGCVYIRAGVDGATSWIPRVARNRKQICGFTPSLSASQRTAAAQSVTPTPSSAVRITAAQPEAQTAPAATPTTTVASAPAATAPVRINRATVATPVVRAAPATTTITAAVPVIRPATTVAAAQPRRVTAAPRVVGNTSCTGLSPVSAKYMGGAKYVVRCGPQAELPYTVGSGRATAANPVIPGARHVVANPVVVTPGQVSPTTRVIPRHVYEQRALTATAIAVPDGYKPAHTDDRLNYRRAEGTFTGKANMELVWTSTVPRRLIEVSTGRDVTAMYPHITYPNTTVTAAPYITSQSRTVKPAATAAAPVATVSTKSVEPTRTTAQLAGKYVQVGAYLNPNDAQSVAQRLKRMGYPAKIGKLNRNGQVVRLVLAGPFASPDQTHSAFSKLKASGYSNAQIRR